MLDHFWGSASKLKFGHIRVCLKTQIVSLTIFSFAEMIWSIFPLDRKSNCWRCLKIETSVSLFSSFCLIICTYFFGQPLTLLNAVLRTVQAKHGFWRRSPLSALHRCFGEQTAGGGPERRERMRRREEQCNDLLEGAYRLRVQTTGKK